MKSFLQYFFEDLNEKFKPTIKWMEENYKVLNDLLFDNELGKCHFEVFTTGKGSQGNTYGWFSTGRCFVDRTTRQMYIKDSWGDKEYVTRENFDEILRPTIKLNGNYSATEDTWLHVLAHEMVHYFTYMEGYCPKQGHGPEFRRKANEICDKSDGWFSIERFITADASAGAELDDKLKQKEERRMKNKLSKVKAYFVYFDDGLVRLTLTSHKQVVDSLLRTNQLNGKPRWDGKVPKKIVSSDDPKLIEKLFNDGYSRDCRTYRSWTLPDNLKNIVDNYEHEVIGETVSESVEHDIEISPDMNLSLGSPLEKF